MLFALGAAYDGAKEFVKAEDAYLDAIDLIPDFPGPRQNLAVLYFLGKDYDLAEKYAREELVITKGDKSAQKLLDVIAKERRDGRPAAMEPKK
jgi:Flp pilus assembly protein TadD